MSTPALLLRDEFIQYVPRILKKFSTLTSDDPFFTSYELLNQQFAKHHGYPTKLSSADWEIERARSDIALRMLPVMHLFMATNIAAQVSPPPEDFKESIIRLHTTPLPNGTYCPPFPMQIKNYFVEPLGLDSSIVSAALLPAELPPQVEIKAETPVAVAPPEVQEELPPLVKPTLASEVETKAAASPAVAPLEVQNELPPLAKPTKAPKVKTKAVASLAVAPPEVQKELPPSAETAPSAAGYHPKLMSLLTTLNRLSMLDLLNDPVTVGALSALVRIKEATNENLVKLRDNKGFAQTIQILDKNKLFTPQILSVDLPWAKIAYKLENLQKMGLVFKATVSYAFSFDIKNFEDFQKVFSPDPSNPLTTETQNKAKVSSETLCWCLCLASCNLSKYAIHFNLPDSTHHTYLPNLSRELITTLEIAMAVDFMREPTEYKNEKLSTIAKWLEEDVDHIRFASMLLDAFCVRNSDILTEINPQATLDTIYSKALCGAEFDQHYKDTIRDQFNYILVLQIIKESHLPNKSKKKLRTVMQSNFASSLSNYLIGQLDIILPLDIAKKTKLLADLVNSPQFDSMVGTQTQPLGSNRSILLSAKSPQPAMEHSQTPKPRS